MIAKKPLQNSSVLGGIRKPTTRFAASRCWGNLLELRSGMTSSIRMVKQRPIANSILQWPPTRYVGRCLDKRRRLVLMPTTWLIMYFMAQISLSSKHIALSRFQSRINALEEVQPSLRNPSDHYPVIADLLQKSTQTAKFCRTCWNANDCQQNLAQSSHTGSLPKKPVQYHCSGKSSCSVMCIFPGVKSWE